MLELPQLDSATHVVQVALTPIFLLAGLGSLLNVFSQRLARIADRVDKLSERPADHPNQLRRLRVRSRALDLAVLAAALAGMLTCAAGLTLFLGALRNAGIGLVLYGCFGGALILSVFALAAFSVEIVLSGRSIMEQAQPDGDQQENVPLR